MDSKTPVEINGYPVVAMVRLPDRKGHQPHHHVVVCEYRSIARDTTYTVWSVTWQQIGQTDSAGHWVAQNGRYDIATLDRALLLMTGRAADFTGRA